MFLQDLADLFEANGLGVPGQTLFISSTPILPNSGPNILLILATGGTAPVWVHNENLPAFILPGAQVRSIGPDYLIANDSIQAVYHLIAQVKNQKLSNTFYRRIHITQEPFDLGMDSTTGRVQIAFNMIGDLNPS